MAHTSISGGRRIDAAIDGTRRGSGRRSAAPRRGSPPPRDGTPPAQGPADDDRGADQHQILQDVLAFHRRLERKAREGDRGKEGERRERSRHLQQEQDERDPEMHAEDEEDAYRGLPEREDDDGGPGIDEPEAQS